MTAKDSLHGPGMSIPDVRTHHHSSVHSTFCFALVERIKGRKSVEKLQATVSSIKMLTFYRSDFVLIIWMVVLKTSYNHHLVWQHNR